MSCAFPDSYFEREFKARGWEVVVITEEDDLTSTEGLKKALRHIEGPDDVVWHSQPCVGGCPWQRINAKKSPETRDKIKGHWKLFEKLWKSFMIIASHAKKVGAQVYQEWPRGCAYWKDPKVENFLQKHPDGKISK